MSRAPVRASLVILLLAACSHRTRPAVEPSVTAAAPRPDSAVPPSARRPTAYGLDVNVTYFPTTNLVVGDPPSPLRAAQGCPPRVTASADSNARYVFSSRDVAIPARLRDSLPVLTGYGVSGTQGLSFVVDTFGVPGPAVARTDRGQETDLLVAALRVAAGLRFIPAEHHAGCRVPQRVDVSLVFR